MTSMVAKIQGMPRQAKAFLLAFIGVLGCIALWVVLWKLNTDPKDSEPEIGFIMTTAPLLGLPGTFTWLFALVFGASPCILGRFGFLGGLGMILGCIFGFYFGEWLNWPGGIDSWRAALIISSTMFVIALVGFNLDARRRTWHQA